MRFFEALFVDPFPCELHSGPNRLISKTASGPLLKRNSKNSVSARSGPAYCPKRFGSRTGSSSHFEWTGPGPVRAWQRFSVRYTALPTNQRIQRKYVDVSLPVSLCMCLVKRMLPRETKKIYFKFLRNGAEDDLILPCSF